MEGEFRLEVGLFEVREDPAGICGFVLGVQVALAVCRVDEAVHSFPGGAVERGARDGDLVLRLEVVQPDPGAVHDVVDVKSLAVEEDAVHLAADEVQERGGSGISGGEVDDAAAGVPGDVRIRSLPDVQGDVVAVRGDQG